MSIVSLKTLLKHAQQANSAIGMFDPINIESLEAIVRACESINQPAILALAEVDWDFVNIPLLSKCIYERAKSSPVSFALHLDHGYDMDLMKRLLDNGFTSIMIDASSWPFEENVIKTRKVVELAKEYNASVEAELGKVGGNEGGEGQVDIIYTPIDDAVQFVQHTNVDALAVSIGTVHGHYKGEPNIDFDLLSQLNQRLDVPLVLHGASGLSDEVIKKCISEGIRKINIFTDLMTAPQMALLNHYSQSQSLDLRDISAISIEEIKKVVIEKLELFQNN